MTAMQAAPAMATRRVGWMTFRSPSPSPARCSWTASRARRTRRTRRRHGCACSTASPSRRPSRTPPTPTPSRPPGSDARIAGRLMTYWSGNDLVAPVVDVPRHMNGRMGFVTRARARHRAGRTSATRASSCAPSPRRFLDAGLPTWQVTPYNPRAIGNLIESPDGSYRVIDLESNLVAPLFPVSGIVGMIRQGTFPDLRRHRRAEAERIPRAASARTSPLPSVPPTTTAW